MKIFNQSIKRVVLLCFLSVLLTACGGGGSSSGGAAGDNGSHGNRSQNGVDEICQQLDAECEDSTDDEDSGSVEDDDSGKGEPLDVVIDPDALMSVPSKEPELIRADADDWGKAEFQHINSVHTGEITSSVPGPRVFVESAKFTADEDLSNVLFYVSSDEGLDFEVQCLSQSITKENDSSVEFIIIEQIYAGEICDIRISLYGDKDSYPYRLVVAELNRETLGMTADEHLVQLDMLTLVRPCTLWDPCYHRLEKVQEFEAGVAGDRNGETLAAARPWNDQLFVNFKQGYLKTVDGIKLPFIEVNSSHERFTAEKREQYQKDDTEGMAANEEKTTYSLFVKPGTAEIEGTFSYLLKINSTDYRGTPNDTSDDHSLEVLYQAEELPVGGKVLFFASKRSEE